MPDINIKISIDCSKWCPRFSNCCTKKDKNIDEKTSEVALEALESLKEPETKATRSENGDKPTGPQDEVD